MMQLASRRVSKVNSACVCKLYYSTQTQQPVKLNQLDEFKEVDHMLRPPQKQGLTVLDFHKKHYHKSRFESYDIKPTFKTTTNFIKGDEVPTDNQRDFVYPFTIKRNSNNNNNNKTREESGGDHVREAKELQKAGTPPNSKWLSKAMYDTGSAAQVEELYEIAEKLNVVDNKLISTYIYNLARRGGHAKAVAKYESVKERADDDIYSSGVEAYAKSMKSEKALEIYNSFVKRSGVQNVSTRVHAAIMNHHFDNGSITKGVEVFNAFEKAGGKADVKLLTSLLRGHKNTKSIAQVQKIFDSIKTRGLKADRDAYSELIIAYSKSSKDVPAMMSKIEEMKNAGFRVPHHVYSSAIRSMLYQDQYHNGLMALDMQYREGSLPLDKRLVIMVARHFSNEEKGMRIRPKTEYAIWIAKNSGLYTKDLTYLTKQHIDYLDEYYFRHHPEWDYPDHLRKPYQYKFFDEFAMYNPEEDRNPFKAKLQDIADPDRTFREDLPSFQEPFNLSDVIIDVAVLKTPTAEEKIKTYDYMVLEEWCKGSVEQAKEAQQLKAKEALARWDKTIQEVAKIEAEKAEKERIEKALLEGENPNIIKEGETDTKEGEAAKADESSTKAVEAAKEGETTKDESSTKVDEAAKEEETKVEAEAPKASEETKVEDAPKEESVAEAVKEAEKEAAKDEPKSVAKEIKKDKAADDKLIKAVNEVNLFGKKAKEAATDAKAYAKKAKKLKGRAKTAAEHEAEFDAEEEEINEKLKEDAQEDQDAEIEYNDDVDPHEGVLERGYRLVGGLDSRPDDSILPENKRMPDYIRQELVQQARVERLIKVVNSTAYRIPPVLPAYLLRGLDAQRIREFINACEQAEKDAKAQTLEGFRTHVDTAIHAVHVRKYKEQAHSELTLKSREVTPVERPLELEEERADLFVESKPVLLDNLASTLGVFLHTPDPAASYITNMKPDYAEWDKMIKEAEEKERENAKNNEDQDPAFSVAEYVEGETMKDKKE